MSFSILIYLPQGQFHHTTSYCQLLSSSGECFAMGHADYGAHQFHIGLKSLLSTWKPYGLVRRVSTNCPQGASHRRRLRSVSHRPTHAVYIPAPYLFQSHKKLRSNNFGVSSKIIMLTAPLTFSPTRTRRAPV